MVERSRGWVERFLRGNSNKEKAKSKAPGANPAPVLFLGDLNLFGTGSELKNVYWPCYWLWNRL